MRSNILLVFLCVVYNSRSSTAKLCCDPECKQPISYGRTVARHITRDKGFLSYPSSAIVTVFSKQEHFDENGREFWEVEIQGKRGLIQHNAINELTFKCQPKEFQSEEERNDYLPPQRIDSPYEANKLSEEGTNPSDIPFDSVAVPPYQTSSSETDAKEEQVFTESSDHIKHDPVQSTFERDQPDVYSGSSEPEVPIQSDSQSQPFSSDFKDEEVRGFENLDKPDEDIYPTTTFVQEEPPVTHFEESYHTSTQDLDHSVEERNTLEPNMINLMPTPESSEKHHASDHVSEKDDTTDQIPITEVDDKLHGTDPTPVPDMDERKPVVVSRDDETFSVDTNDDTASQMQGNLAQPDEQEELKNQDGMPSPPTPPLYQPTEQFDTQTAATLKHVTTNLVLPTETPPVTPPPVQEQTPSQASQPVISDGDPGSYDLEMDEEEFWDDDYDEDEDDEMDQEDEKPWQFDEVKVDHVPADRSSDKIEKKPLSENEEDQEGFSKEEEKPVDIPTESGQDEEPFEDITKQAETTVEHTPRVDDQHSYHKQEDKFDKPEDLTTFLPGTVPGFTPPLVPTPAVDTISESVPLDGGPSIPDLTAATFSPPSAEHQDEFDSTPHKHDRGYDLDAVKRRLELARERSRQYYQHDSVDKPEAGDDSEDVQPSEDHTPESTETFTPPTVDELPSEPPPRIAEEIPPESPTQLIPTPEVQEKMFDERSEQPPAAVEEVETPDTDESFTHEQHPEPTPGYHPDEFERANKSPEGTPSPSTSDDTPPTWTAPVTPDFEIPPPPPVRPAVYNCRDEYIPLPGSDSGWLAVHEKVRAQARDWVLDTLPEEWSEWICTNRPMLGMVFTSMICFSLMVPLLFLLCQSCRSTRRKSMEVLYEIGNRRKVEEKVLTFRADNSTLEKKLRETMDGFQNLKDDLSLCTQERDQLAQEKRQLEMHYQTLNHTLAASQQEVTNYVSQTEQLNSQITLLEGQFAAVVTAKDTALQQIDHLSATIEDYDHKVQGLEAQKDQLEQDKYSTQTALTELQAQHETVCKELEETKLKCTQTESELHLKTTDLLAKEQTLSEKEEELQSLRNCLHQVIEKTSDHEPGAEEGVDAPSGEETPDNSERLKSSQLAKIEAMLDTTKVQTELRETIAERDHLLSELSEKTTQLEHDKAEKARLNELVSSLETKLQSTSKELEELQIKMKGVTEYFQEKEHTLHAKLEAGEQKRLKVENLESEAHVKAAVAEQERQKDRQELNELRNQMKEIERSYISQVKNNEQRAEDAISQLRRTEQDLRQANREITALKRRLADMDNAPPPMAVMRPIPHSSGYMPQQRTRPPSTDPQQSQGPPPAQPPRPVSAPRLDPRTSSPTTIDGPGMTGPMLPPPPRPSMGPPPPPTGGMPKSTSMTSMLNTSHPGPSRPRMDLPPRPRSRGAVEQPSGVPPPSTAAMRTTPLGTAGPQSSKQLPLSSTTPQHMQHGFSSPVPHGMPPGNRPPVRPTRPMYQPPSVRGRFPPTSEFPPGPRPPLPPQSRLPPPRMGGPRPPMGPPGPGYYSGGPPPRRDYHPNDSYNQHQSGPYKSGPNERGSWQGSGAGRKRDGETGQQTSIESSSPILHESPSFSPSPSESYSSHSDSSPASSPHTTIKSCLKRNSHNRKTEKKVFFSYQVFLGPEKPFTGARGNIPQNPPAV